MEMLQKQKEDMECRSVHLERAISTCETKQAVACASTAKKVHFLLSSALSQVKTVDEERQNLSGSVGQINRNFKESRQLMRK